MATIAKNDILKSYTRIKIKTPMLQEKNSADEYKHA
jgi:hypothetical protein